jgi:DNA adenine methylase
MAIVRKNTDAGPFLKWAGGKSQILPELEKRFPKELTGGPGNRKGKYEGGKSYGITRFIEPFIGGGAVYFRVNYRFRPEECHIFDINPELVLCYRTVKDSVEELIEILENFQGEYLPLDEDGRKEYYYNIRSLYNDGRNGFDYSASGSKGIERTAKLIFLNRTCFNGLYRVNNSGGFNVPMGKYKNPTIAIKNYLIPASESLENTQVHHGDFEEAGRLVDENTFLYFDPPYRPLNKTSSFNSYAKDGFTDDDQRRLAAFFRMCSEKSAKVMLSNSDPKNNDPDDNFFDDLYKDFNIERVPARRMINSDAGSRGAINEIVVTNYVPEILEIVEEEEQEFSVSGPKKSKTSASTTLGDFS